MDIINLLPVYRVGLEEIKDGLLIKAPRFCLEKHKDKCKKYYQEIYNCHGNHKCPYGFSSYVINDNENSEIFTAFRLEKSYEDKAKNKIKEKIYNPIINNEQLDNMLNIYKDTMKLKNDYEESTKFVKDIVHEIKNFNYQVITKSEKLVLRIENSSKKKKDNENLEVSKSIYTLSSLISLRFSAYDATVNPEALKFGGLSPIGVHQKFYKIKMCYDGEAGKKNINIRLIGSSTGKINGYYTFDLLPFLLLDNAIKYSPEKNEVSVNFEETKDNLKVIISSYGPYLSDDEVKRVFLKGFRSSNAVKSKINGSGIGLYLAQTLCLLHNIDIKVSSEQAKDMKFNSIDYGVFKVELNFLLPKG